MRDLSRKTWDVFLHLLRPGDGRRRGGGAGGPGDLFENPRQERTCSFLRTVQAAGQTE